MRKKKETKKSTIQYLVDNDLDVSTGLYFTCKDYDFCIECVPQKIIINQDRMKNNISREETLTKKDIEERIKDLYFLMTKEFKIIKENIDLKQVEDLLERIKLGN